MAEELGLSELIYRVKQELLSEDARHHDLPTLFSIDEIALELNFVIHGDVEGGFNLGVVTVGSQVGEERVQKVTIKMTPLISPVELMNELEKEGLDREALAKRLRGAMGYREWDEAV